MKHLKPGPFESMLGHHHKYVERGRASARSPEYEDLGLFKTEVLKVQVHLTPVIYRTSRQDVIVRGFDTAGRKGFEVAFAGRRATMAAALIASLEGMKNKAMKDAKRADRPVPLLEDVRLPVTIEGAWRRRFWTDTNGWQTGINQLVAARWIVSGAGDKPLAFGAPPAIGSLFH